jgi:hypothetical protein
MDLRSWRIAGGWWLTPVILATQEAEIRRIAVRSQASQIVPKTLSQKYLTQKGLVEWLMVWALCSSPGTTKKKKKEKKLEVPGNLDKSSYG